MDLSIVIVNYNGASFLTGCLDAIFDGMLNCEFEVIVIDNASQDQSLSVLERYQYPLKRIDNADNRGFAAANNQGVAIAEGRYVFLLNNDTVVAPDAIQTLVDFFDNHPQTGILSPQLLNRDGSLQGHGSGLMKWRYTGTQPVSVGFVTGAAMMMTRALYRQIGGFDENYFFYNEDLDICKTVKKLNRTIIYLPTAKVTHFGGLSTATRKRASIVEGYRGGLYFCKKHYGDVVFVLYRWALFVDLIPRFIVAMVVGNHDAALAYRDVMGLALKGKVVR